MAELINVTDEAGASIVINLDFVVRMVPGDKANMSLITIADGTNTYTIQVQGSPQEIASAPPLKEGSRVGHSG